MFQLFPSLKVSSLSRARADPPLFIDRRSTVSTSTGKKSIMTKTRMTMTTKRTTTTTRTNNVNFLIPFNKLQPFQLQSSTRTRRTKAPKETGTTRNWLIWMRTTTMKTMTKMTKDKTTKMRTMKMTRTMMKVVLLRVAPLNILIKKSLN